MNSNQNNSNKLITNIPKLVTFDYSCMETYPCQHDVSFINENNKFEKARMFSTQILERFKRDLEKEEWKMVKEHLIF